MLRIDTFLRLKLYLNFRYRDQREITDNKKYTTDYSDNIASLIIKEVTEKDTSSYTCEASNDLGSVKTTGQLEVQGKLSNCYPF